MLYLGIDQHKRQLTVNLRAEDGAVLLKRQVSSQWEKVRTFFCGLLEKARPEGGFLAIVEVCGMNPWLLDILREYGCREIVVIQPTKRSKQKTDRRDADALSHLLWVHRQQFLEGKHPLGLRRVQPPTVQQAADRQLTALRAQLTKKRTAVLNGIHKILRNLVLATRRETDCGAASSPVGRSKRFYRCRAKLRPSADLIDSPRASTKGWVEARSHIEKNDRTDLAK